MHVYVRHVHTLAHDAVLLEGAHRKEQKHAVTLSASSAEEMLDSSPVTSSDGDESPRVGPSELRFVPSASSAGCTSFCSRSNESNESRQGQRNEGSDRRRDSE